MTNAEPPPPSNTEPRTSPAQNLRRVPIPSHLGGCQIKSCPTQAKSSLPSILKVEEARQGQEGAEGMAKNTHPLSLCSPSVEIAENMAMVTFPPLSRRKKGGL